MKPLNSFYLKSVLTNGSHYRIFSLLTLVKGLTFFLFLFTGCGVPIYFEIEYGKVQNGPWDIAEDMAEKTETERFNDELDNATSGTYYTTNNAELLNVSPWIDTSEATGTLYYGYSEATGTGTLITMMENHYQRHNDNDYGKDKEPGGYLCFVHRLYNLTKEMYEPGVTILLNGNEEDYEEYKGDAMSAVAMIWLAKEYPDNWQTVIPYVTAHELGEAFNLGHCKCIDCIMYPDIAELDEDNFKDNTMSNDAGCCESDQEPGVTHFTRLGDQTP